jgi:antitoxin component YwqK of YwqJK toxin-antitoxin module
MRALGIISVLAGTMLFSCTPEEGSAETQETPVVHSESTEIDTVQVVSHQNSIVWEERNDPDFDTVFPVGKFKEYTFDGRLITEGEQVEFNACFWNGGTWKHYDEQEVLTRTITYHIYDGEMEGSCHDTQIDLDVVEYYPSGQIQATKFINSCSECSQFKVGTWTYYSEKGEIDSTQVYPEPIEMMEFYY